MKPCDHDSRPLYERLVEPLRAKARELGYALAVHGSLKRDIDLVAVPWTSQAVPPRELADALQEVARTHNGGKADMKETDDWFLAGCPAGKPHGRLCWSYHLGGGPYIDLSVVPRRPDAGVACAGCGCLNTEPPPCWSCGRATLEPDLLPPNPAPTRDPKHEAVERLDRQVRADAAAAVTADAAWGRVWLLGVIVYPLTVLAVMWACGLVTFRR